MYDLVIRKGTIVDGTGLPRYRADVGIIGDRIATVSRVRQRGRKEIDATGYVVTPGFIDGHTHMDAQVFWDELGSCSCWHGVTTVVMGNCGFTLAPGKESQRALVLSNIEQSRGRIVNVGAAAARQAGAGMGAYAASKAGVERLTQALAEELKDQGVNVNAVLPSILDTPANRSSMPDADYKRWVAPADLARVIAFLLSNDSAAVTGALIPVTGKL
jgi:N-acyl-D-aspartate/D-glutamate deacylase